jgi:ubiquinone/menaquinone biosynthesis methyltransferase
MQFDYDKPSKTHLVLIPSYNPGPKVYETVKEARAHWNPVWVVVDGSNDGTDSGLASMAEADDGLHVLILDKNQGKGAAVLRGLDEAASLGFTHALCMDSDGQHPANLIPEFMASSLRIPDAMVLGVPVFNADAPRLRVNGRKISNWWANLETLWSGIGDSLYGFRVYPIAPLQGVMRKQRWMRRFDFDPEAVVRLCWRGVKLVNLPAPVKYLRSDEGGVSHFNYLRDNILLTWMHIRLIFGFGFRLPFLLYKKLTFSSHAKNGVDERSDEDSIAHAPHAPLTDYYPGANEKREFVRDMFDSTAEDYDAMEFVLGLGKGVWYRGQALERAGLKSGMKVVDVGIGTGLVAREAVRITGDANLVVGVDPSLGMMKNAKLPGGVRLLEGRAEAIPFPGSHFDFLSMGYALRHINDLSVAFEEFYRVMKPGAKLCLLEITCPESYLGRFFLKMYMKEIIPAFARIVGRNKNTRQLWRYYWDTIEACVPPQQVLATLSATGFINVHRHIELKSMSVLAEYQATKPE